MDFSGIPKSFWHAVSFSLIIFTLGFLVISYSVGEVYVKFRDLEVSNGQSQRLAATLEKRDRVLKEKEDKISEIEQLLTEKIGELKQLKTRLASKANADNNVPIVAVTDELKSIADDSAFNQKLNINRSALNSLSTQQVQLRQTYQQQQQQFDNQQQQQQQK